MTARPPRIRRPLLALSAAALSVLASACGQSTAPTAASSGAGPDPIEIAIITDASVPGAGSKPETAAAAKARVDAINAAGGLHGRKLVLTECDTKGDPNTAQACARTVVAGGAVAVVGLTSTSDSLIAPMLEKAGIASIGTTPLTPVAGDSKTAFCFNPGIAGDFLATAPALAAAGAKKVALLFPGDVGAVSANAKAAFETGAKVGKVATGPAVGFANTDTQFEASIAKAVTDGVDGVAAIAPGTNQATLIAAVRRQQPTVKVGSISVGLTPEVITALGPAAEGVVAVALTQPATATDIPGIKKFNADMDASAPSVPRTDLAINAWAAVYAFEQLTTGTEAPTRAGVLAAVTAAKDLDLGGIYPKLSAADRSAKVPGLSCAMNTKVVFEKVQNGQLVALHPGEFYDPFGG